MEKVSAPTGKLAGACSGSNKLPLVRLEMPVRQMTLKFKTHKSQANGMEAPVAIEDHASRAIVPQGRFLLAAGQLSNRVGVHRIDPYSGALALLGEHEVGANPSWVETVALR